MSDKVQKISPKSGLQSNLPNKGNDSKFSKILDSIRKQKHEENVKASKYPKDTFDKKYEEFGKKRYEDGASSNADLNKAYKNASMEPQKGKIIDIMDTDMPVNKPEKKTGNIVDVTESMLDRLLREASELFEASPKMLKQREAEKRAELKAAGIKPPTKTELAKQAAEEELRKSALQAFHRQSGGGDKMPFLYWAADGSLNKYELDTKTGNLTNTSYVNEPDSEYTVMHTNTEESPDGYLVLKRGDKPRVLVNGQPIKVSSISPNLKAFKAKLETVKTELANRQEPPVDASRQISELEDALYKKDYSILKNHNLVWTNKLFEKALKDIGGQDHNSLIKRMNQGRISDVSQEEKDAWKELMQQNNLPWTDKTVKYVFYNKQLGLNIMVSKQKGKFNMSPSLMKSLIFNPPYGHISSRADLWRMMAESDDIKSDPESIAYLSIILYRINSDDGVRLVQSANEDIKVNLFLTFDKIYGGENKRNAEFARLTGISESTIRNYVSSLSSYVLGSLDISSVDMFKQLSSAKYLSNKITENLNSISKEIVQYVLDSKNVQMLESIFSNIDKIELDEELLWKICVLFKEENNGEDTVLPSLSKEIQSILFKSDKILYYFQTMPYEMWSTVGSIYRSIDFTLTKDLLDTYNKRAIGIDTLLEKIDKKYIELEFTKELYSSICDIAEKSSETDSSTFSILSKMAPTSIDYLKILLESANRFAVIDKDSAVDWFIPSNVSSDKYGLNLRQIIDLVKDTVSNNAEDFISNYISGLSLSSIEEDDREFLMDNGYYDGIINRRNLSDLFPTKENLESFLSKNPRNVASIIMANDRNDYTGKGFVLYLKKMYAQIADILPKLFSDALKYPETVEAVVNIIYSSDVFLKHIAPLVKTKDYIVDVINAGEQGIFQSLLNKKIVENLEFNNEETKKICQAVTDINNNFFEKNKFEFDNSSASILINKFGDTQQSKLYQMFSKAGNISPRILRKLGKKGIFQFKTNWFTKFQNSFVTSPSNPEKGNVVVTTGKSETGEQLKKYIKPFTLAVRDEYKDGDEKKPVYFRQWASGGEGLQEGEFFEEDVQKFISSIPADLRKTKYKDFFTLKTIINKKGAKIQKKVVNLKGIYNAAVMEGRKELGVVDRGSNFTGYSVLGAPKYLNITFSNSMKETIMSLADDPDPKIKNLKQSYLESVEQYTKQAHGNADNTFGHVRYVPDHVFYYDENGEKHKAWFIEELQSDFLIGLYKQAGLPNKLQGVVREEYKAKLHKMIDEILDVFPAYFMKFLFKRAKEDGAEYLILTQETPSLLPQFSYVGDTAMNEIPLRDKYGQPVYTGRRMVDNRGNYIPEMIKVGGVPTPAKDAAGNIIFKKVPKYRYTTGDEEQQEDIQKRKELGYVTTVNGKKAVSDLYEHRILVFTSNDYSSYKKAAEDREFNPMTEKQFKEAKDNSLLYSTNTYDKHKFESANKNATPMSEEDFYKKEYEAYVKAAKTAGIEPAKFELFEQIRKDINKEQEDTGFEIDVLEKVPIPTERIPMPHPAFARLYKKFAKEAGFKPIKLDFNKMVMDIKKGSGKDIEHISRNVTKEGGEYRYVDSTNNFEPRRYINATVAKIDNNLWKRLTALHESLMVKV